MGFSFITSLLLLVLELVSDEPPFPSCPLFPEEETLNLIFNLELGKSFLTTSDAILLVLLFPDDVDNVLLEFELDILLAIVDDEDDFEELDGGVDFMVMGFPP